MNKISTNFKRLSKNKKKLIVRTYLFAGFLLVINTYAWFVYLEKFNGNINANVIGWDVSFFDENSSMKSVAIKIDRLYPGMKEYLKEIVISNNGDINASFDYEITEFKIFGKEYDKNVMKEALEEQFPYKIIFTSSKQLIETEGDSSRFKINIKWDFESKNDYYKLNELYEYSEGTTYYVLVNNKYIEDETVDNKNYISKVKSGLYIESDDADSYWGRKASEFKKNNPSESCLTLKINLIVSQTK